MNHGDDDSCEGLAKTLTELFGVPAMAPYSGAEFDLLKGEWVRLTDPVYRKAAGPSVSEPESRRKESPFNELMDALESLRLYASGLKEASNGEIRELTAKIRKLTD